MAYYPSGGSGCGALDLAGNVFEWTASSWAPYPDYPGDGGEFQGKENHKVFRGGAWSDDPTGVRVTFANLPREESLMDLYLDSLGWVHPGEADLRDEMLAQAATAPDPDEAYRSRCCFQHYSVTNF